MCWFKFFPNDWLGSQKVMCMTPAEEGAYIRLLCIAYNSDDCGIPDNDAVLASLSRLGSEWVQSSAKIRECFRSGGNGRLYNDKLLEQRVHAEKVSSGRSANAKQLHSKCRANAEQMQSNCTANAEQMQSKCRANALQTGSGSGSGSSAPVEGSGEGVSDRTNPETKIPDALNTPAFLAAWSLWVRYCDESLRPMRQIQADMALKALIPHGPVKAASMIEASIAAGWKSINEPMKPATQDGNPRKGRWVDVYQGPGLPKKREWRETPSCLY